MNDDLLRKVLAQRPCALLTDIDGTISPIASTPGGARVTPEAQRLLRELSAHIELVGAVSGRAAADAAQLVGIPSLTYIGNHGLEIWQDGAAEPFPEARPFVEPVAAVLRAAEARIDIPGVIFENKGVTGSVHYRLTPDPATAEEVLGDVLRELSDEHGLRLTAGRMVWELRPPLDANKGTAVRQLVEQRGLRGVMFLGDDRTDADAFRVLRELDAAGQCVALNVGVDARETPDVVRKLAHIMVDGVEGVEAVLARLVELAGERPNR